MVRLVVTSSKRAYAIPRSAATRGSADRYLHRYTTNCGKLLNRWEYQTTFYASGEICMQVKKQQLELDME